MIVLAIGIPAAVIVLACYACCVVSGRISRQEELRDRMIEENREPVWNEDDRKYSGLLEEDEP